MRIPVVSEIYGTETITKYSCDVSNKLTDVGRERDSVMGDISADNFREYCGTLYTPLSVIVSLNKPTNPENGKYPLLSLGHSRGLQGDVASSILVV